VTQTRSEITQALTMFRSVCVAVIALVLGGEAFQSVVSSRPGLSLRMSQETEVVVEPAASSRNRLGSSVDQDGKSNIWAVEPKMRVDEAGAGSGQAIAVAAGAVLAFGLIASAFLFINVEQ